jgi:serine/threonine protein kinase
MLIDSHEYVRIADFGLSGVLCVLYDGTARAMCGTPGYIAPEVLKGCLSCRSAEWARMVNHCTQWQFTFCMVHSALRTSTLLRIFTSGAAVCTKSVFCSSFPTPSYNKAVCSTM